MKRGDTPESPLRSGPASGLSLSDPLPQTLQSQSASPLPAAPAQAGVPYGALAVHYNTVMAHVDYPGWARHLRGLWRSVRGRGAKPGRVLELAAGTCRMAAFPLFRDAFTVHTDLSPAMLACAARAGVRANDDLPLHLPRAACDARALPFRDGAGAAAQVKKDPKRPSRKNAGQDAGFDLVLMVYDSLNYLTRPDAVRRAFDEALRVLAPGGVFLFDVTTATCSRRHFADLLDFQETEAGAVVRVSRYDAESRTQLNLFTFFTEEPDGRYARSEEVHRQRIWPAAFLKKTAREAGFTVRACLADFTLKPGNDRHERLHFILQKP